MAENNEEQYLDELLNSLRSSNSADENSEEQDSVKPEDDIITDDGTEVIDNADKEDEAYSDIMTEDDASQPDDIGPIIDEPQPDDIGPIIDEPQPDDIGPIIDEPQPDDIAPVIDEQQGTADAADDSEHENSASEEVSSDETVSDDSSSKSDSMDDIFALEDNFDMGGDSVGAEEPEAQQEDIPLTLPEADEVQPQQEQPVEENSTETAEEDDEQDDGLMQLLNQINGGEDAQSDKKAVKSEQKNDGIDEPASKDAKTSKEEERARKKAEKLAKKEQRKKEKEEKKKNKKDKEQPQENTDETTEADSYNAASQENIDLINELYSETDSLDNAPLGDDLADIPERDAEEEEPKKPKKEKKKKEPKPKKPKKEKVKKEKKAPKPSELVKVTPKTFLGIIIFAVVITVVVIFGTKIVNYSVSVRHAIEHFNNGKYDQAFDSIAGLEVKDKDKDTYYKIRTVASVYVDYTSYVNYRQLGMKVEALDSLIKGLGHYDDYYSDAEKYDVVAQYDGVKDTIIEALAQYGVSEEDARYYAGLESEEQYKEILNNIGGRMQ